MQWFTLSRIFLVLLLLVPAASITQSYAKEQTSDRPDFADIEQQAQLPVDERTPVVGERENSTVISYQYGQLAAFAPNGTVLYYDNSSFYQAFDVDPVPGTESTVLRVGNELLY